MAWIELESLDEEVRQEIRENSAFLIDTSINYDDYMTSDELIERRSIFNWRFMIKPNYPLHILEKMHSCECGNLSGQLKDGMECDLCFTKVSKVNFETDKMAYMPVREMVPTPHLFIVLSRLLTEERIKDLLEGRIDLDLYNDFEKIIDTHIKKKDEETLRYAEEVKKNKKFHFSHYIPVISYKLRYMIISENMNVKKVDIHDANTPYILLSRTIRLWDEALHDSSPLRVKRLKLQVYSLIAQLKNTLIVSFAGDKKKIVRADVYATRMPYTSIAVLTPLTTYFEADSCTIPIETFRCVFKLEIKEIMLDNMGMDLMYVNKILDVSYVLSEYDKNVLREVFTKVENPDLYINRQPTINWGSILMVRIREIRDELVLRMHPNLFAEQVADCDGDALIMVYISKAVRPNFKRKFSATNRMIVYDRKLNPNMNLKNDIQVISTLVLSDEEPEYGYASLEDMVG